MRSNKMLIPGTTYEQTSVCLKLNSVVTDSFVMLLQWCVLACLFICLFVCAVNCFIVPVVLMMSVLIVLTL